MMAGLSTGTAIDALVMIALFGSLAWRGYRRRRPYWSRASWITFGLTMLAGFALVGLSLYFAADVGRPWMGARGSGTRAAWILVVMSSLLGGMGLAAVCLSWFARDNPTKQFTLERFTKSIRAVYRNSERISHFTRDQVGAPEKERALREPPRADA